MCPMLSPVRTSALRRESGDFRAGRAFNIRAALCEVKKGLNRSANAVIPVPGSERALLARSITGHIQRMKIRVLSYSVWFGKKVIKSML